MAREIIREGINLVSIVVMIALNLRLMKMMN
jgi:hypothetical protein